MVQELFTGLYRAGQYPVTVYPTWLRVMLTYLVPLGFAITVPSESLTGRLTAHTFRGDTRIHGGRLRGHALVLAARHPPLLRRLGLARCTSAGHREAARHADRLAGDE